MKIKPYIAKIVECYQTNSSNLFCREEKYQELDHHLDWKIIISVNVGKSKKKYPVYGIVASERNERFFNTGDRLTCRSVKENIVDLKILLEQDINLDKQIQAEIKNVSSEIKGYYDRSGSCEFALKYLKTTSSIPNWLSTFLPLYEGVTIRPKGLPPITDS